MIRSIFKMCLDFSRSQQTTTQTTQKTKIEQSADGTYTIEKRPMTVEELKVFEEAMKQVDKGFEEIDKAFDLFGKL
jgi:hypothetical protein